MLETPHVIVGAVIAARVANPYLSLPLSFASHFILEKVPHWNPHLSTEMKFKGRLSNPTVRIIVTDSLLASISAFLIASKFLPDYKRFILVIVAGFLASVPDLLEAPYFFLNSKNKFIFRWTMLQKSLQEDASFLPGMANQLAVVIASILWLFS